MFNIRRAGFKQGYSAFPSAQGQRVCPERVKSKRKGAEQTKTALKRTSPLTLNLALTEPQLMSLLSQSSHEISVGIPCQVNERQVTGSGDQTEGREGFKKAVLVLYCMQEGSKRRLESRSARQRFPFSRLVRGILRSIFFVASGRANKAIYFLCPTIPSYYQVLTVSALP